MKLKLISSALAMMLLLAGVGLANAHLAKTLDEAKTMSAETGLPILMEVGTDW